jgi:uncharacterized SAM-binding protein YcdF (DUF218 family)
MGLIRGFILALFLVALAYGVSFVLFVSLLPRTPAVAPRADAIVVLTGGDARLDTAASLFEDGLGRRMLVSGVDLITTRPLLKRLMHNGARFDCCVDIGYAAEDTHGNAVEAADWARAHGFKTILLVTARYHMPRAKVEFQKQMGGIAVEPYPVDQSGIDLSGWWRHRGTVLLLSLEYVKYLTALAVTALT